MQIASALYHVRSLPHTVVVLAQRTYEPAPKMSTLCDGPCSGQHRAITFSLLPGCLGAWQLDLVGRLVGIIVDEHCVD